MFRQNSHHQHLLLVECRTNSRNIPLANPFFSCFGSFAEFEKTRILAMSAAAATSSSYSLGFPATGARIVCAGFCNRRVSPQFSKPRMLKIRSDLDSNVSDMTVNAPKGLFPPEPEHYRRTGSPQSFSKSTGFLLQRETFRSCSSSLAAGAGNTTALTSEQSKGHTPFGEQPNPDDNHENIKKNDEERKDGDVASEKLDNHKMLRVCDKLIGVFMVDKPTPTDWRRLLTFSKEWDNIRPHFYKRCQDKADSETDPGMRHKLLRFLRKLKEIDEDVQRHNELLEAVRNSPSEVGEIVAKRCKDFTKEFFVHLHTFAESLYDNPTEQNDVAKLGNQCIAAVQAYDTATDSIEAINAAELKFQDIINSPSVDAACRKIDSLAEKNQLDSALVLMISKAWSAAKESNMMKDEVKDILYHLYTTARGNLQRMMPKEIRILKYLLTIEDPEEHMSALKAAFTPGQELEGKDIDCLYTTPEQLHTWIGTVVNAYHFSREGTLIKEARDLMNPKVVQKMEELKKIIQDNFM